MPDLEVHRQKCRIAESAQRALQAADSNQHADWIVIAAFYQALHWVDAFFAFEKDHHPERHGPSYDEDGRLIDAGRNKAVNLHPNLRRIVGSYRKLYDASITARYQTETYQDDLDEVEALLEEDLARIVTHISRLIGESQFQT